MGNSIKVGDVNGSGNVFGSHSSSHVSYGATGRELVELVATLREQVKSAELPEATKEVLLTKTVQPMEASAQAGDKSKVENGLVRLNDQLEVLGVTAKSVEGLLGTAKKIAAVAGVAAQAVPFLAKFF